jgi:hemerythrin-like domain-containing protein
VSGSVNEDLLFDRKGLPEDLRFLIQRYPRDSWRQPGALTSMGRFWLKRHNLFRELGGILSSSVAKLQEEDFEPREFAGWFAPRLHYLLSDLEGHHHVEDSHYFPIFLAAEPRLRRGFDILDSDHQVVHDLLERNADAGTRFVQGLEKSGDAMLFAAEEYGIEAGQLVRGLMRHLEDEEDLIVPLLLDRRSSGELLM